MPFFLVAIIILYMQLVLSVEQSQLFLAKSVLISSPPITVSIARTFSIETHLTVSEQSTSYVPSKLKLYLVILTSSLWSVLRPVTTSASLETPGTMVVRKDGSSLTVWLTEFVSSSRYYCVSSLHCHDYRWHVQYSPSDWLHPWAEWVGVWGRQRETIQCSAEGTARAGPTLHTGHVHVCLCSTRHRYVWWWRRWWRRRWKSSTLNKVREYEILNRCFYRLFP